MASTKAAMRFHQTGAMWRETETREKKSNVERIQRKKDASFNKEIEMPCKDIFSL